MPSCVSRATSFSGCPGSVCSLFIWKFPFWRSSFRNLLNRAAVRGALRHMARFCGQVRNTLRILPGLAVRRGMVLFQHAAQGQRGPSFDGSRLFLVRKPRFLDGIGYRGAGKAVQWGRREFHPDSCRPHHTRTLPPGSWSPARIRSGILLPERMSGYPDEYPRQVPPADAGCC